MGLGRFCALAALAIAYCPEGALGAENCFDHCSLEKAEDGRLRSLCDCDERKFPLPFPRLRAKLPARFAREVAARLRGATAEDIATVSSNACAPAIQRAGKLARPASLLRESLALSTRPLCECVATRIHFPLRNNCWRSKAGQTLCEPEPWLAPSDRAGPLREASLNDYESCVANRVNYRPPETCEDETCHDAPIACASGEEAVNIADPQACCPVFECRGKEDL